MIGLTIIALSICEKQVHVTMIPFLKGVLIYLYFQVLIIFRLTLENHCTRTAQSTRGGCSRRVQKVVYLTVNNCNILIFFTSQNIHRELLSLINPAVYLVNKFLWVE